MKQTYTETPTAKDLSDMNLRISALKERAKKSKVDAKESFNTQIRALEDQYDLVTAKLNKVSRQAGAMTGEVQNGLSKAWLDLKSSFDSASKFLH